MSSAFSLSIPSYSSVGMVLLLKDFKSVQFSKVFSLCCAYHVSNFVS